MFEFGDKVEFDYLNTRRTGSVYATQRTGWITILSSDETPGQFYDVHPDAVRKIV
jgi:hypothetical protein